METNRILLGNCQKVLVDVPDNSVDLIPTDPPSRFTFMGKDWDKAVPRVAIWSECLRVLKPGAFAFVMSSPRADVLSRMIVNLGDAGFRTDFTPIYWAYASGFPKAMNISKAVDKRLGLHEFILVPTKKGNKDCDRGTSYAQEGFSGFRDVSDLKSEEAKLLDGSYGGFQPKPAVEVIIVAMKPLGKKTFVDQALANGKGVTWLDNCRIPFQNEVDSNATNRVNTKNSGRLKENPNLYGGYNANTPYSTEQGRFPANLLVSDDVLNDGINHKVNVCGQKTNKSFWGNSNNEIDLAGRYGGDEGSFSRFFSLDAWFEKQFKKLPSEVQKTFPFLITPKASRSERETGCEKLSDKLSFAGETTSKRNNDMYSKHYFCTKCGYRHDGCKCEQPNFELKLQTNLKLKTKNFHPTVKPLQLMSYLITLGSRTGDLVLDPFVGSGTTCLAAKMLGRHYLGIELNKDYYEIAQARVENHKTLFEFASEIKNIS